jgi:hypothetical protein
MHFIAAGWFPGERGKLSHLLLACSHRSGISLKLGGRTGQMPWEVANGPSPRLGTRCVLVGLSIVALALAGCSPALTGSSPSTPASAQPAVDKEATRSLAGWWLPPPGTSWQWQLTGLPVDTSLDVEMYDIDLFDNEAPTVAALQAQGRKVVCYLSAGSWEDWRPDANQFPASVLGQEYEGWPGERWLDIRQIDLLAPVMRARLDRCQAMGFDGVEPDNVDGYANETGFPLTYGDQLAYNRWLAAEAHARGLSIGLKNDGEQVRELLPDFDWALTEDCFAQEECGAFAPFVAAGKAVFAAEYTDEWRAEEFTGDVCPQAGALAFRVILKDRDLDAWQRACP